MSPHVLRSLGSPCSTGEQAYRRRRLSGERLIGSSSSRFAVEPAVAVNSVIWHSVLHQVVRAGGTPFEFAEMRVVNSAFAVCAVHLSSPYRTSGSARIFGFVLINSVPENYL